MPAEELAIGLVPVSAILMIWVRTTGQRVRDRLGDRHHH
jgi:hypothetical protein